MRRNSVDMVYRTLVQFTGKRIPLIRFRKGGYNYSEAGATSTNQASSASTPAPTNAKAAAVSNAIEDWQLPPKYWRKPIDTFEMEYINRGGPA